MKKYVLRANCFGYNDENYYVCGMELRDTFDKLADAEAAYREAQLDYLRELRLGEHEKIFNGESDFIRWVDDFIHEKTGKRVATEHNGWVHIDDSEPAAYAELSEDDLFELGEQGGFSGFKLVEFDDDEGLVALWNPRDEELIRWSDEYYAGVLYGASAEDIIEFARRHEVMIDWQFFEAHGSPEELSDSPELFRSTIAADGYVDYDESDGHLRIDSASIETIIALNELLKTPIFEFRNVSLDELRAAQADQSGDAGQGDSGSVPGGCAGSLIKLAAGILVPAALVAGGGCLFSGCDNFFSSAASVALSILKWLGYGILALAAIALLLYWRSTRPARKKPRPSKEEPPTGDA